CASEQAVILDDAIADEALAQFARLHAHVATAPEKVALERFIFGTEGKLNPDVVGRSAAWIAAGAGFSVPAGTSVILVPVEGVGDPEPLTREKLCPVLALLRAGSREEGFTLAERMVELDGLGH